MVRRLHPLIAQFETDLGNASPVHANATRAFCAAWAMPRPVVFSPAMTAHTFLWHDYETFGAVPRRDRPSQFAAIRTDAELNEIGEPLMIYCKPAPDYLPSPEACLITGITPQQCLERGIPEHEFAARIEQAFAQPGTIGVGYNTIRFDDEVTRFLFWRSHRSLCARVAERLRALGPARCRAPDLCAAARRHRMADTRKTAARASSSKTSRAPMACCTRRRTMPCRMFAPPSLWRA